MLLRIVQGFSAGGEWGGAALMAVEHAPADKRGKFGAFPQVGVPLGMLLATGFLAMLSVLLTEEQFVSWGWRVPFLFSIVLIGIGMWIRLGVTQSPVFQERDGAGGHLHHPRPHRWAPLQGRPRPAQAGRLVHPLPEDLARSLSSSKGPGLVEGVGQSEGCPARRTDVPGTTVSSCGHEAPAGCPPGYPSRTALTIERFVVAESKSELVYTDLRRRIVHGEFTAGYRLVLARLAAHYGVSPVPVREALRRLEAEGLLRYTRNVGAEVVGVNQGDYAETMQVLAFLEGAATALAAPLLDADALERARRINAEMSRVREEDLDAVLFTTLNHEFHEVICAPCPNEHLSDLLGRERDRIAQVRRSSFTYVPERSLTSVEEHENILQLIASGAPAREVELAARDHKLRTMNQFLDARRVKPAVAAR